MVRFSKCAATIRLSVATDRGRLVELLNGYARELGGDSKWSFDMADQDFSSCARI